MCSAILLCSCTTTKTLTNPVIDADRPDPSVIKIGNTFYAAATSGNHKQAYPRFKSKDLKTWEPMGYIFEQWPEWSAGAFWAPELFELNGKVLCYYTAKQKNDGTSCIGVAVADGPEGVFVDHGPLIRTTNEAIDAFVYKDGEQLYVTWKAYGLDPTHLPIEILGQRLSKDGLRLEGAPFTLVRDDERLGCEGQCIFKQGEYYYMLYSIRDCCSPQSDYAVSVARSKHFTYGWEKYDGNPILTGNDTDIQSCGHGTMVKWGKDMYYLCHAYYFGKYKEGRKAIVEHLSMGNDKWPHFDNVKANNDIVIRK